MCLVLELRDGVIRGWTRGSDSRDDGHVRFLGMAGVNQHLHRKTTTLMTNDPVAADAFRP